VLLASCVSLLYIVILLHRHVVMLLAGSKYAQTGMFEVTKAEEEPQATGSPPPSPGAGAAAGPPKSSSALRVTVPSELQGVAYIEVLCQKG
jgi:mediator of RNA polymerase II transcription subunit 17